MYSIKFLPDAKKELEKIDFVIQKQIKEKITILASNPFLLKNNIKPLKGKFSGKFRLRVRSYRIIFRVVEKELIIIIVRISHRSDIY